MSAVHIKVYRLVYLPSISLDSSKSSSNQRSTHCFCSRVGLYSLSATCNVFWYYHEVWCRLCTLQWKHVLSSEFSIRQAHTHKHTHTHTQKTASHTYIHTHREKTATHTYIHTHRYRENRKPQTHTHTQREKTATHTYHTHRERKKQPTHSSINI